jgi:hypothetical protein
MRRQRVALQVAAGLLILHGLVHLVGHLAGAPAPTNPTEAQLMSLMSTYHFDVGGAQRTTDDIVLGFSLSYTILLLLWAVLLLVFVRTLPAALLARVALVSAAACGLLLGIGLRHFPLPPTILFALTFVAFALACRPSRAEVG